MTSASPLYQKTMKVAVEIESLDGRLDYIERGLEKILNFQTSQAGEVPVKMLQELDFLRQNLDAIGKYLLHISSETDDFGNVCDKNALSFIPLHDLSCRLSGSSKISPVSSGVDLF